MKYDAFSKPLRLNMPEINELIKLEYSDDEINQVKESYLLEEININKKNMFPDLQDIGWLFSKYKLSNLEIGMITFLEIPAKREDLYIIGKVEDDDLVYSINGKNIFVQECGVTNILWNSASNPENFISGLDIMCEYFSKVMIDESLYDNFNYLEQIALKASKAAGGSEYLDFYKMLLGI